MMQLTTELQALFEQTLHLPNNPMCQRCDAKLKHPLPPRHACRSLSRNSAESFPPK